MGFVLFYALTAWAQRQPVPRFEDYPVTDFFNGTSAVPRLVTPEERRFRAVIDQGVSKGYGVLEEPSGKERPGPNFAGHYFIVRWGCGSPCVMAAIVDAKSGRVLPPPFHPATRNTYFQVLWAFPMDPLLDYRLNSRLLIARICERDRAWHIDGHLAYRSEECGVHYFLDA